MRHPALLFVISSALAPCVAAQGTLPITAGQRVRLTLDGGRPSVVGLLVAQDGDSLRVQPYPDSALVGVHRAGVTSIEVSEGRHGHAGSGALVGLLVGGALGAVAGASCSGEFLCFGAGGSAVLVGAGGAAFGALVGVFTRSERWERVYPERVRVGLVKTRRRLGVAVSVPF